MRIESGALLDHLFNVVGEMKLRKSYRLGGSYVVD